MHCAPVSPTCRLTARAPSSQQRTGAVFVASGRRSVRPKRNLGRFILAAGSGTIDKPALAPGIDIKKDTKKKKPPRYRVMLHNDNTNRREYVVQVLLKVIDGLTVDDAVNVMNEAHINGLAAVIVCAQEEAEKYCEGLRGHGLISSIEPCGPKD